MYTTGHSTACPSSMVEPGVHRKRPARWVVSYQRKGFSSVKLAYIAVKAFAIRVQSECKHKCRYVFAVWNCIVFGLASLWTMCITTSGVPGVYRTVQCAQKVHCSVD